MRHARTRFATTGLSILLLTACGGGGSSSTPPPPPPAAADIVALGPLTNANNFTVNGTSYTTATAAVDINGATGVASSLRAGQIVRVRGETAGGNTATALDIEYDANVIGPIESVDLAQGVVVVMGQRVHITPDTILDPALDSQSAGLTAEVSGHVDAFSEIAATRIDLVTAPQSQRVWGKTRSVDGANFVFRINALTLDYSNALVLDVEGGEIVEGVEVIVTGTLDAVGVLNVSEIVELNRDTVDFVGFTGSLAGVVTRFTSPADFDVAGIRIVNGDQAQFVGGSATDLHLGVTVQVDGSVDASGALALSQVAFAGTTGSVQTVDFAIDNFTGLKVGGPFLTTLTQGPDFLVRLTVDAHIVPLLDVRREGTDLHIGFRDDVNIQASTLRARIEMPNLEALVLAGATHATVSGFTDAHLQVLLAGAVFLAVDDSHFQTLSADLAGACAFFIDDSRIDTGADVTLVGASTTTVNLMPGASLTGSSIAASALLYYGDNIDVDVTRDLTSTVARLGGTR